MLDQVMPALKVTWAPPSLPSIMRAELTGSIHKSWLSPCEVMISVKLDPPSVDFHILRLVT